MVRMIIDVPKDDSYEALVEAIANGHWYETGEWEGGEKGHCTNCGHKGCASDIWNGCTGMYCPNCGADLNPGD